MQFLKQLMLGIWLVTITLCTQASENKTSDNAQESSTASTADTVLCIETEVDAKHSKIIDDLMNEPDLLMRSDLLSFYISSINGISHKKTSETINWLDNYAQKNYVSIVTIKLLLKWFTDMATTPKFDVFYFNKAQLYAQKTTNPDFTNEENKKKQLDLKYTENSPEYRKALNQLHISKEIKSDQIPLGFIYLYYLSTLQNKPNDDYSNKIFTALDQVHNPQVILECCNLASFLLKNYKVTNFHQYAAKAYRMSFFRKVYMLTKDRSPNEPADQVMQTAIASGFVKKITPQQQSVSLFKQALKYLALFLLCKPYIVQEEKDLIRHSLKTVMERRPYLCRDFSLPIPLLYNNTNPNTLKSSSDSDESDDEDLE